MKNTLSIIIGIIVIALIAFIALRPTPNSIQQTITATPPPVATTITLNQEPILATPAVSPSVEPKIVAVSIDDEGFSPSTVTIPVGTTVVFTNNGQANHRPASDPHPTHDGLPGLDAGRWLVTGETYSFVFTKAGTFGIHDHPRPQVKASITVLE